MTNQTSRLILAGETGGTKTVFTLLDENGTTLVRETGRGVASLHEGILPVENDLRETLRTLYANAKICPERIVFCYFSLGGPNQEEVTAALKKLLPNAEIRVGREADGDLALFCAEKFKCSACLLAGTGTVAVGQGASRRYFSGGWGPDLDDCGGGGRIGLEALTAALLAFDGRTEKTLLTERLLKPFFTGKEVSTFAGRMAVKKELNALSRSQLAACLPAIRECARSGDASAIAIFNRAAKSLADLAASVTPLSDPGKYRGVLCLGGIFKLDGTFLQQLEQEYTRLRPDGYLRIMPDDYSLGSGAAEYAMFLNASKPCKKE